MRQVVKKCQPAREAHEQWLGTWHRCTGEKLSASDPLVVLFGDRHDTSAWQTQALAQQAFARADVPETRWQWFCRGT